MSIKISELPEATSVNDTDELPIVQNGTTKKASKQTLTEQTYSTTEKRVGTWMNGKPLYEKVLTGTTPTVTTDGTQVNITNQVQAYSTTNEAYFVTIAFVKYHSSPHTVWAMPYYNNSMRGIKAMLQINSSNVLNLIIASDGTAYNNCTYTAVVRYTKTTDTATRNLAKGTNEFEIVPEEKELITEETKTESNENNEAKESGDAFVEFNPTSLELPNEEQEEKLIEEITDGIINATKETAEQEKQNETPETKEEQK